MDHRDFLRHHHHCQCQGMLLQYLLTVASGCGIVFRRHHDMPSRMMQEGQDALPASTTPSDAMQI